MDGPAHEERPANRPAERTAQVEQVLRADGRGHLEAAHWVMERSPTGMALVYGERFICAYVNPAFRRIAGIERGAAVGRPIADVVPGLCATDVVTFLGTVYATGVGRGDAEVHPDGRDSSAWRLTAWTVSGGSSKSGEGPQWLALELHDATEERLERQRRDELVARMRVINEQLLLSALREQRLSQEAAAASVAKSDFLATMSHELRTPLTAIVGYGSLLSDGMAGPLTDAQRQHIQRIKISADHLLTLIDGVLTLSRSEAGKDSATFSLLSVAQLVDEAATLILPMASAAELRFTSRAPREDLFIETDQAKARQVLVNLLSNAIKFTGRGGEITLSVIESDEYVALVVRDTGIGIAAEHLEHIFEPFWQVDQGIRRRVGGTGLGLTVSRRLARLLGGDLTVASTPRVGTEFTFRLPLTRTTS